MARLLISVLFLGLGISYFRTQVVRNSDFALRAEENRLRVIPVPAPRGSVYDRNGEVVATTATTHTLTLEPAPLDTIVERIRLLAPVLGLDSTGIRKFEEKARKEKNQPLLLSSSLTFDQLSILMEQSWRYEGLVIEDLAHRHYPYAEAVSHIIGYVGEISKEEMTKEEYKGYKRGQQVGKAGIERQYESILGGRMGTRIVEIDARGRVVGKFAPRMAVAPKAGKDLRLTIDAKLQRFSQEIFPKGMRGAIVAMEPSTGEILTLYSNPSYDPNQLNGGVNPKYWSQVARDANKPLINRATSGIYPPGSTWKLATALVGLENGVVTPEEKMPYACNGGMSYAGRYSRCWYKEGHGSLDLAGAIMHSCNVYFYQLGIRLGLNQLAVEGTRLGFNRKTGIDLPTEKKGTFPADTRWYERVFGWKPTPSEVMSLSIGQGPNAQTPLRMAQFFSALAGNGTARVPHLVRRDTSEIPIETDLGVSTATLQTVWVGMARVMEPGGTAYMASLKNWKMYGKTGTSQNTEDPEKPHAWFTGFAGPHERAPEIVVAVIVEFGESGSQAAAPIAAKVADFYLNQKHGRPTERLQTLRERLTGKVHGQRE